MALKQQKHAMPECNTWTVTDAACVTTLLYNLSLRALTEDCMHTSAHSGFTTTYGIQAAVPQL
jgi:hypothetical protein